MHPEIISMLNGLYSLLRWGKAIAMKPTRRSQLRILLVGVAAASMGCVGLLAVGSTRAEAASTPSIAGNGSTYLYASPAGTGSTCSLPLPCSLTAAQAKVRNLNGDMREDIVVQLAGGTYELSQPLTFTAADSGNNGHQIRWEAAPGAHPVISGGERISGWQLSDPVDNIWSAPVPSGLDTLQLYVDGVRADVTRSSEGLPAGSVATSTGFTVPGDALQSLPDPGDLEFIFHPQNWAQQECGVSSITGSSTQTIITMKQPCWDTAQRWPVKLPEYVDNNYTFLSKPGEWYLDRSAHRIYYIPRTGQDMSTATVVAPVLQQLVTGAGTPSAPVHNLTFEGLTFSYATWLQPSQGKGFPEVQADLMFGSPESAMHWAPSAFVTPTGGQTWDGIPYGSSAAMTPDAVEFHTARNVQFIRNTFTHLGAAGLGLDQGSQHDTVTGNTFTDISANGLQIGSVSDPNQTNPGLVDEDDSVRNNYVHNVAVDYQGGVGMFFGYVRNTVIAHNEIAGLPYSGISLGWGWGSLDTLPSIDQDNQVIDNYVHDVMTTLYDGGGIYSLGPQPEGNMSGNYVSNVVNDSGSLYLDQGSAGWTVDNNVLAKIGQSGIGGGVGWWFHNNPNYFDPGNVVVTHNYTDTSNILAGTANISNTTVVGDTTLPASIINEAGLQPAFADINPTTPSSDTQPPTTPRHLQADILLPTSVHLTWTASQDNTGVTGYEIYVNDKLATVSAAPDVTLSGLTPSGISRFTVKARDAAANLSLASPALAVRMPPPDPPTAPQEPTATAPYPTTVDLSWPTSTDKWGISGYLVYQDGVLVQRTVSTTATIEGLTSGQTYQFTVVAENPADELSAPSPAVSVTTPYFANLALNAPASCLYLDGSPATLQPDLECSYADDGNVATYAQASGQYAWQLQVDLGSQRSITSIVTSMPDSGPHIAYATEFNIEVSTDGQTWTIVRSVTGFTGGVSTENFTEPVTGRYVRIVAVLPDGPNQVGGQMAISELDVYGS